MRKDQFGKALLCLLLAGTQLASPLRAADVNITSNVTTGVNLDLQAGATAEIAAGVSVTAPAATNAIVATTRAWAVTNSGSVTNAGGLAVVGLRVAGSSVTNFGTIASSNNDGVWLFDGGTVENKAGATIAGGGSSSAVHFGRPASVPQGWVTGGPGTLVNAGTISNTSTGGAVRLDFGGSVTNLQGGSITTTGVVAVTFLRGISREVTNSGLISATGGSNATGVEMSGGAATLVNTSTGEISGLRNGVYAGSDGLTLTNSGTIQSTNNNANSIAVEAGGSATISNSGTVRSTFSTGILLGGAGTITNTGTVSGAVNAIRFGTSNVARTLVLGTGSSLVGNVVGSTGTGIDTLQLQGSGTESLTRFTNFEQLSMTGSAWTLSGSGTFSTSASVTAGRLTVSGALTTPSFTVGASGILSGTGSVIGAVTNAGGIDVGTGTLAVTGSVVMSAGSQLQVGVTPAIAGRLAVTGSATLAGSSVRVAAAAGTYAPSTTYTILTATTALTDTFTGGVTTDRIFLSPVLTYDANNVYLTLNRGLVSFASVGQTANQIATGAGLDTLPGADPLAVAAAQLSLDAAPVAFDQVSGEIHAALPGALAATTRIPREAALRVIDDSFAALADDRDPRREFWAQAFDGAGSIASDGNAAELGSNTGGILVGSDLTLGDLLVSVFGGVGSLGVSVPDRSSSAAVDQLHLGIAAGQEFGAWRLKGGVIVSANAVSTTRTPAFAGFSDTDRAQYWAGTGQLFADLSYAIDLDEVTLRPFGRLALIGVTGSRYAETGGSAALTGGAAPTAVAIATLGLTASTTFELGDGLEVEAHGTLAVQQTLGTAPSATHRLASGGDFTVNGASPAGTAVLFEAGLSAKLSPTMSFDLGYSTLLGGSGQSHAFKATLSGSF